MGNPKAADTGGHFELSLDGAKTTSFLKSIDGGFWGHSTVDEAIGSDPKRIRHAALGDLDQISFEVGMSGATSVLQWIQDSWNRNFQTRSGQINHANFNLNTVFEQEFSDALITETTFPGLDGGSKEAAYLKVKFQPRAVAARKIRNGPKLTPVGGGKQKQWLCNAFRLSIDGIDDAKYCNKIESFTIKQGTKKLNIGGSRLIQLAPTKIDFPPLVGTIALEKADGFLEWYDEYVVRGKRDPLAQKSGSIEFLTPDRAKTLFRIALFNVGITKAQIPQSTANADQIKRLKFELYVGDMKLDGAGALGLE